VFGQRRLGLPRARRLGLRGGRRRGRLFVLGRGSEVWKGVGRRMVGMGWRRMSRHSGLRSDCGPLGDSGPGSRRVVEGG
jgi:hypothetical protein